jgi:hypothetical protein
MIGIDIGIHSLNIPYKKKNLSLIKIDYWSYESFYCKIDPARLISKPSKSIVLATNEEKSKDLGVFNLVVDSEINELLLNHNTDERLSHELCIEIYEEYELIEGNKEVPVSNGLELVCAGKILLNQYERITSPIHPLFKSDSLMNCCSFLSLIATSSNKHCEAVNLSNNQRTSSSSFSVSADHILKIPLFYKTQNRFAISAGSLSLSVKLYRVDETKLKNQHPSLFHSEYCSCCQPPPTPRKKEIVKEKQHDISFQSETTRDQATEDEEASDSDEDYDGKDDDSLDEFIDSFLKRYEGNDRTGVKHTTEKETFLPPPPPPPTVSVKSKKPVPQKKKKAPPSSSMKNRDYVEENKAFPKPRKPSRIEQLRYLKFK